MLGILGMLGPWRMSGFRSAASTSNELANAKVNTSWESLCGPDCYRVKEEQTAIRGNAKRSMQFELNPMEDSNSMQFGARSSSRRIRRMWWQRAELAVGAAITYSQILYSFLSYLHVLVRRMVIGVAGPAPNGKPMGSALLRGRLCGYGEPLKCARKNDCVNS
jgi:hypothetical protein